LVPVPAEGRKATKPPEVSANTVFSYWVQIGLTICGNAPLTSFQFDPGSCVTVGWRAGLEVEGEDGGDSEGLVVLVADGAADAVADALADGPAGKVARKLP
jgi:hypothetical protein